MAQKFWKYTKPKKRTAYDTYFRLEQDIPVTVTINHWKFARNEYNDSLFSTSVIGINGQPADKIWSVWDYALKENLLKGLKKKNPLKDNATFTITMTEVDEEDVFVVEWPKVKKESSE